MTSTNRRELRGWRSCRRTMCAAAGFLTAAGALACGESSTPPPPLLSEALTAQVATTPQPGVTLTPLGYEAEINSRVAAVDLDQDGREEIAVASARELVVLRPVSSDAAMLVWRGAAQGGATAVTSGDIDGDGHPDLLVGWGAHRDHRDAAARLVAYRTAGAPPSDLLTEPVVAPTTSRAQFASLEVTSIEPGGPTGVLYTAFASKYDVRGAFAWQGGSGFQDRELLRIRMAAQLTVAPFLALPGAQPALVVGRAYGDELKSNGDVFILEDDGERTPVPSFRGVRSLLAVSLGPADAPIERVCYGDGWHWRYKDQGRGLVTCAWRDADGLLDSQLVQETASYGIDTLAAGDVDGDGRRELLAQGPEGLYAFAPTRGEDGVISWSARTIGPGGYHFAVVDVDGDGRDELALAGENPALLRVE